MGGTALSVNHDVTKDVTIAPTGAGLNLNQFGVIYWVNTKLFLYLIIYYQLSDSTSSIRLTINGSKTTYGYHFVFFVQISYQFRI